MNTTPRSPFQESAMRRFQCPTLVAALLGCCLSLPGWAQQSPEPAPQPAAVPARTSVGVARLDTVWIQPEREAPAHVIARNESKLSAEVSGTLLRWTADVGAQVARGQVLAQIDPRDAELAVQRAQAALDAAIRYAGERKSFGTSLLGHQAVSFRLVDAKTRLEAARQLVLSAARMKDAGQPCLDQACMAKLFASEIAEEVCSTAIQTFGGYGYVEDFPVERIYRDVRVCQIYEGTSDIQKIIIGRSLAA